MERRCAIPQCGPAVAALLAAAPAFAAEFPPVPASVIEAASSSVVITVEPIIAAGLGTSYERADGWTVATRLLVHERNAVGGGSPYTSGARNGPARSGSSR